MRFKRRCIMLSFNIAVHFKVRVFLYVLPLWTWTSKSNEIKLCNEIISNDIKIELTLHLKMMGVARRAHPKHTHAHTQKSINHVLDLKDLKAL